MELYFFVSFIFGNKDIIEDTLQTIFGKWMTLA